MMYSLTKQNTPFNVDSYPAVLTGLYMTLNVDADCELLNSPTKGE